MDYVFRRLALDHLPYETRAEIGILSAAERAAQLAGEGPAALAEDQDTTEMAQSAAVERPQPVREASAQPEQPAPPSPPGQPRPPAQQQPHSSMEVLEAQQGLRTRGRAVVPDPAARSCARPAACPARLRGLRATSGCS